ncbi:GNAT family N-acetyltransferase, partial [Bacillus cereus]|nr:GNAT family N-acetyltransferase [Bacillus cereus]
FFLTRSGFVCEGLMRNDRLRQGKFIHRYRYSILKEEYESKNNNL